MYTRWRLYILGVFAVFVAAILLAVAFLRKRGHAISHLQAALFVAGATLCLETFIIAQLSNFNLGVILPAFFGAPLMALAFLLPHMQSGLLRAFKWFVVGCYALACLIFVVCGALMLSAQKSADKVNADALIVLGAAVHGDRITWVLENRLNTAADYLARHPDAICVVSGGQGAGESVTEGSAMKKYLVGHGVSESRVFAEERATNTKENFRFSKDMIDALLGPDASIAFVTTDFHVYRASRVAAAQGVSAAGVPAPDVWYLRLNNFLRECVGICVYGLRGDLS